MDAIVDRDSMMRQAGPKDTETPLLEAWHVWLVTRQGDTERHVLSDCCLKVHPGEMVAIIGEPRDGRSALMAMLAGFEMPTRGVVLFQGEPLIDPFEGPEAAGRRRQIGYLFPSAMLLPGLSAAANVATVLGGLHREGESDETVVSAVADALARSGFSGDADAPVQSLGRAERTRAALAACRVKQPLVLLCDAAADGLSPDEAAALVGHLDQLRRETGMSIVIAGTDAQHPTRADRVMHLSRGRLGADTVRPR